METYNGIWERVYAVIEEELKPTLFELWFSDVRLGLLTEKDAYLVTTTDFKKDILEKKYTELTAKSFFSVLGFEITPHFYSTEKAPLDFSILDSDNSDIQVTSSSENTEANVNENSPDPKDPTVPSSHRVEYTFDNFIVGNSNRFAHAAAIAVAENPASDYNPLFIHGASGLGKTHLMWAIMNYISDRRRETNLIYVKGDDFTNQMIESIRRETTSRFREKYRRADVLLIDDIQFIAGKDSTQEEFFHTFNALYEDHKQIIMTSDRPPRDIKTLEDRLKTRFEWGLIADVQPPDFELRIAIMKNKAENLKISMSDDVLTFLAENLRSNVRQLEGAIKKLGAQSFLTGVPITKDLAISCVSDLLTGSEPVSVTVDRILDQVSKKYDVTVDDLKSKKRTKEIASARHISIYLMRKLTDMSTPAIGKIIGRDHTTIMNSLDVIESEIKVNSLTELEINELIKDIKETSV